MKISVIYDDKEIFVEFTPDEFRYYLEQYLDQGFTVKESMEKIIEALKHKTLTA